MTYTLTTPAPRVTKRAFHAIPIIGRMAREIEADHENFYYFLVILLTLLILAIKTWGIVALAMSALAMVPVVFTLLIMVTLG